MFVPSTSTRLAIGFFLDHDDSIEEGLLANGFNNTAAAWEVRYTHDIDIERAQYNLQARFGVPYSACACPRKTSTATALAARMLKLTVTSKVDKAKRLLEQGTPESLEYQDASHPSDHNSVLVDRVAQVQRSYEYERLRAKEGHKRKGKGKITKETPPETTEHTTAFVRDERTAPS